MYTTAGGCCGCGLSRGGCNFFGGTASNDATPPSLFGAVYHTSRNPNVINWSHLGPRKPPQKNHNIMIDHHTTKNPSSVDSLSQLTLPPYHRLENRRWLLLFCVVLNILVVTDAFVATTTTALRPTQAQPGTPSHPSFSSTLLQPTLMKPSSTHLQSKTDEK